MAVENAKEDVSEYEVSEYGYDTNNVAVLTTDSKPILYFKTPGAYYSDPRNEHL